MKTLIVKCCLQRIVIKIYELKVIDIWDAMKWYMGPSFHIIVCIFLTSIPRDSVGEGLTTASGEYKS